MNTAQKTISVLVALGDNFHRMAVRKPNPTRAIAHADAAYKMYDAAQAVIALAKNSNTGLDAEVVETDANPTLEDIRRYDELLRYL